MIRTDACVSVVSLSMLIVLLAGCAGHAPVAQASAPTTAGLATGGASRAAPTVGESARARASGERAVTIAVADIPRIAVSAPTSIQWPVPKDFVVRPKLTPIYFDFDKFDIRPGDATTRNAKARWRYLTSPGDLLVFITFPAAR